ncbi:uncharacterized protein PSFLO_01273 [Pseudozyma flocculosa]|uniref:Uncharacterized protein n=1 Tax=Pseudozyma flocculosa TaxID=84751 RepID=A0A5C3EUT6_9BASI|nr:uncharacterized protein PSFLO_01273 [Pseudozyma flocculosa]
MAALVAGSKRRALPASLSETLPTSGTDAHLGPDRRLRSTCPDPPLDLSLGLAALAPHAPSCLQWPPFRPAPRAISTRPRLSAPPRHDQRKQRRQTIQHVSSIYRSNSLVPLSPAHHHHRLAHLHHLGAWLVDRVSPAEPASQSSDAHIKSLSAFHLSFEVGSPKALIARHAGTPQHGRVSAASIRRVGSAAGGAQESSVHTAAGVSIETVSILLIVVPTVLVVLGLCWVLYRFGDSSMPDSDHDGEETRSDHHDDEEGEEEETTEKSGLLSSSSSPDAPLHSNSNATTGQWRATSGFSSTSRGTTTTTVPSSSSSKRSQAKSGSTSGSMPMSASERERERERCKIVGSKAARAEALARERLRQVSIDMDDVDRRMLARSPPPASARKDD